MWWNFFKVITARAPHEYNSGFGNIFIGHGNEIHTWSYILFKVSNDNEAKSLLSYMKCKLPKEKYHKILVNLYVNGYHYCH